MNKLSSLAVYLLVGSLALGAHAESVTIRLHGSNTIGSKLGPSLVEAFARQQGFVGVDRTETAELEFLISGRRADGSEYNGVVNAHGTNTGRVDLMSGAADVWMASRAATPDEVVQAKAIGNLHSPQRNMWWRWMGWRSSCIRTTRWASCASTRCAMPSPAG